MSLDNKAIEKLGVKFRKRAQILRLQAWTILAFGIISIFSGVLYVILSEAVTKKDIFVANSTPIVTEVTDFWKKIIDIKSQHILEDKNNVYDSLKDDLSRQTEIIRLAYILLDDSKGELNSYVKNHPEQFLRNDNGHLADSVIIIWQHMISLQSDLSGVTQSNQDIISQLTKIEKAQDRIIQTNVDFFNEANYIKDQIDKAIKNISSQTLKSTDILVSASIIRIGTILLLIFLVQIIVSLYRYNIKLASYYEARADVMEVIDTNTVVRSEEIDSLISMLTPTDIQFGKTPNSPMEHITDMIKKRIDKK